MICEKCKDSIIISNLDFYFCEKCDLWTRSKTYEKSDYDYDYVIKTISILKTIDKIKQEWNTNIDFIRKYVTKGRALEIGFREGAGILALDDSGFDCYGFDITLDAKETAVRYGIKPEKLFISDDLSTSGINEKFDLITIREVIEHVPCPSSLLKQCKNMLLPNGIIHIQTPRYSKIVDFWSEATHLRVYSVHSLLNEIISSGFIILDMFHWEGGVCVTSKLPSI